MGDARARPYQVRAPDPQTSAIGHRAYRLAFSSPPHHSPCLSSSYLASPRLACPRLSSPRLATPVSASQPPSLARSLSTSGLHWVGIFNQLHLVPATVQILSFAPANDDWGPEGANARRPTSVYLPTADQATISTGGSFSSAASFSAAGRRVFHRTY